MKPMLASPAKGITYPVLASPKIDGVRGYVKDGVLLSRKGIPIPNEFVQKNLGRMSLEGLDGELAVGNAWDKNLMQQTMSGVMSHEGEPSYSFWVFDIWNVATMYQYRYQSLKTALTQDTLWKDWTHSIGVRLLEHVEINNDEELLAYEEKCLALGYEGVMVRSLTGPYKFGRSTAREGYLLKVKRWTDGEGRVTGYNEFMHNANELQQDAFGNAKRSSHQDNKVPMDKLGSLDCVDLVTGQECSVGTGFNDYQRKEYWSIRTELIGRIVKYKHFAQAGVKDAQRHPVFLGFRDERDM